MLLEFSTKRDRNGNRYYLGIDTENKTFSRERGKWYGRDDVIEIGKRDRREIINKLESDNFTEVEYF